MSSTVQSTQEPEVPASVSGPDEWHFPDVMSVLYKRRWVVLSTFVPARLRQHRVHVFAHPDL